MENTGKVFLGHHYACLDGTFSLLIANLFMNLALECLSIDELILLLKHKEINPKVLEKIMA